MNDYKIGLAQPSSQLGLLQPRTSLLENWSLDRVSRIDRIVLWMSLAEMRFFKDIPYKVSIDEAIELAKQFSEAKASGFINGILDSLAKED